MRRRVAARCWRTVATRWWRTMSGISHSSVRRRTITPRSRTVRTRRSVWRMGRIVSGSSRRRRTIIVGTLRGS